METNINQIKNNRPGMTLIELTVVILVLISLISVLFIGANMYKKGADRANCILNIRNVQQAVRAYQNLNGGQPGGTPPDRFGTRSVAKHLIQKGYVEISLYDKLVGEEPCPGGGTYSSPNPFKYPEVGQLYMECDLAADEKHVPDNVKGW